MYSSTSAAQPLWATRRVVVPSSGSVSGSAVSAVDSRFPPRDPLARQAILCGLLELERIGRYDEARQRSLEYMAQNPTLPDSIMIALRAVAYRERLEGYPAVQSAYATFKGETNTPGVREQAELLDGFHHGSQSVLRR